MLSDGSSYEIIESVIAISSLLGYLAFAMILPVFLTCKKD